MISLLLATALAQQVLDDSLETCTPRPIAGTVGYRTAVQATETNAQIYGAVAFAERTILNEEYGFPWAFHSSVVSKVTRIPTLALCPSGIQPGMLGVDMYASASGMAFAPIAKVPELEVFYAGSITGSVVHFPSEQYFNNPIYTTYAWALGGIGLTYAAPLAVLMNRDDNGPQSAAGDFVAGAAVSVPKHEDLGTFRLGYAYSGGLYTNIASDRIKLLASALLTDQIRELALARLGFSGVIVAEAAGRSDAFVRRKLLKPAADEPEPQALSAARAATTGSLNLDTVHVNQRNIGGVLSVYGALAVQPRVFLHEGLVSAMIPADELYLRHGASIGVMEMPAMPWYGVEGGRKLTFQIKLFAGMLSVGRNEAELMTNFPYAQDATFVHIGLTDETIDVITGRNE